MKALRPITVPDSKAEASRKRYTLLLFLVCATAAISQLEYNTRGSQREKTARLGRIRRDLEKRLPHCQGLQPGTEPYRREAELIDTKVKHHLQLETINQIGLRNDDDQWFEQWKTRFLHAASREAQQDARARIQELVLRSDEILIPKFELLHHRRYVAAWYAISVCYLVVVSTLYRCGLRFDVGEPIFNVIDVGYISTIVSYTGGLSSEAQWLYIVSIASSVFQYDVHRGSYKAHPATALHPTLLTAPYVFALFASYFWACVRQLLFPSTGTWTAFAFPLGAALIVATVTHILLRLAEQMKKE